jgi:DtxR family Mn-dependent transcriptional regulator
VIATAPIFLTLAAILVVVGIAALLWPGVGVVAWSRRRRVNAGRIQREDALKHLCNAEAGGRRPTLHSLAGALNIKADATGALLREMEQQGLVSFASGELGLTPKGRAEGVQVIRAHRLWECHLAEHTGIHPAGWHAQAERREHWMSPAEVDVLSAQLGNPTHDPHGDPIPTAGGDLAKDGGEALNTLAPGKAARVVHIEDEPANLYAQLAAQDLRPGMRVEIHDKNEQRIRFVADGAEHEIAPILAHQIEVLPLPETEAEEGVETLASYQPGERATVLGLARGSHGSERRRLLDLGFVAGTAVEVEMVSPSGEPTAYLVRGTVIALHREQAQLVLVRPAEARKS